MDFDEPPPEIGPHEERELELMLAGVKPLAYFSELTRAEFEFPDAEFEPHVQAGRIIKRDILLRSLQRAIYKDEASRRISDPLAGPLFSGEAGEGDFASGKIYVLRSKSDHPTVKENRNVLHKIGVTGGSIENRIANAAHDATFLLADVEVVASYELFNINRSKLENIIHKVFDLARLDIEIKDRFGHPVVPREWFLVPLFAIDDAVEKIKDGTITSFWYDPKTAALQPKE